MILSQAVLSTLIEGVDDFGICGTVVISGEVIDRLAPDLWSIVFNPCVELQERIVCYYNGSTSESESRQLGDLLLWRPVQSLPLEFRAHRAYPAATT